MALSVKPKDVHVGTVVVISYEKHSDNFVDNEGQ